MSFANFSEMYQVIRSPIYTIMEHNNLVSRDNSIFVRMQRCASLCLSLQLTRTRFSHGIKWSGRICPRARARASHRIGIAWLRAPPTRFLIRLGSPGSFGDVKVGRLALARRQTLIINTRGGACARAAASIHVFFLGAPGRETRWNSASEGGVGDAEKKEYEDEGW